MQPSLVEVEPKWVPDHITVKCLKSVKNNSASFISLWLSQTMTKNYQWRVTFLSLTFLNRDIWQIEATDHFHPAIWIFVQQ